MKQIKDGDVIGGYKVRIEQDDWGLDPRKEFDHLGTMTCFHNRYGLGDKTELRSGQFDGWQSLADYLKEEEEAVIILPLYLIDHSGISMRCGQDFSDCDPGHWDSGQVGFIWISKEKMKSEYGNCGQIAQQKAMKCLEAEVEMYSAYIEGDVWMYSIEDEDGESVGGCGGFYGSSNENMEHMNNYIRSEIEGLLKEKFPLFPEIAQEVYHETA
jgi:hypothetical protein